MTIMRQLSPNELILLPLIRKAVPLVGHIESTDNYGIWDHSQIKSTIFFFASLLHGVNSYLKFAPLEANSVHR